MFRRRLLPLLLATTFGLLRGGFAEATTVRVASMQELCAASGLVVRGRVAAIEQVWTGGGPEREVRLTVGEVIKGSNPEATVSFRTEGGRVGRWASQVAGAPNFIEGQEVVVLLERRSDGAWTPTGLSLGVFYVEIDKSGAMVARRSFDGLVFAEPASAPGSSAVSWNTLWSLDALTAFLRSTP